MAGDTARAATADEVKDLRREACALRYRSGSIGTRKSHFFIQFADLISAGMITRNPNDGPPLD